MGKLFGTDGVRGVANSEFNWSISFPFRASWRHMYLLRKQRSNLKF